MKSTLGVLLFSLLIVINNALAMTLTLDTAGLTPDEIQTAKKLMSDVSSILPPTLQSRTQKMTTPLRFGSFKSTGDRTKMGLDNVGSHKVLLNKDLLHLDENSSIWRKIQKASAQGRYSSKHKTPEELVKATLVHEISHVYDFADFQEDKMAADIRGCRATMAANGNKAELLSPACQEIISIRTSVSDQNWFLELAGFPLQGFLIFNRHRANFLASRSPDTYEWTDPQEAFAVNMEFYLLDPEFKCRRPMMYKMLSEHFGSEPFAAQTCDTTQQVLALTKNAVAGNHQFVTFDPSRLYQVHYLLAGVGKEASSAFGHSMLRLVFCAPERKEVGPDCMKDVNEHYVISYRAAIEDLKQDSLKGFFGGYPSIQFVMPFIEEIREEYNMTQLRDIYSYPLKLTDEEKKDLLSAIVEQHWTYQGDYSFINNSCSDETINLLKKGLIHRTDLLRMTALRPDTLAAKFEKIGLTDTSIMKNLKKAEQDGYFFPSRTEWYAKVYYPQPGSKFKQIQNYFSSLKNKDLDDYLNKTTASQRLSLIQKLSQEGDPQQRIKLAASLKLIEDQIFYQMKMEVLSEAIGLTFKQTQSASKAGTPIDKNSNAYLQFLNLSRYFRSPSDFLSTDINAGIPKDLSNDVNYGTPSKTEVSAIENSDFYKNTLKTYSSDEFNVTKDAQTMADPANLKELEGVVNNLALLAQLMKP